MEDKIDEVRSSDSNTPPKQKLEPTYKTPIISKEIKKFNIQIKDNKLDHNLFQYIESVFKNTYFERIYRGKMIIDIVDYAPNEYIPPAEFISTKGIISLYKKVECKFLSYEIGDVIDMYISFEENRIKGVNKYAQCNNIEVKRDDIIIEGGKCIYKNKKTNKVVNFDTTELVKIDKVISTQGSKRFDLIVHFYEE